MFERFTDRARRVIVLAQEEARALSRNYIGSEHILLGIVSEGDGAGAKVLASFGLTFERLDVIRGSITEIVGAGTMAPGGHIPFTPRAKRALEGALREALKAGRDYIDTEHLLLGIIREAERDDGAKGIAERVLTEAFGIELHELRAKTEEVEGAQIRVSGERYQLTTTRGHLEALVEWFGDGQPTEPPSDEVIALVQSIKQELEE
jgi:ATP-dependent Clp protease ATP-binding subunit ClpC